MSYPITYFLVDRAPTANSTVKLLIGLIGGNAVFYAILLLNRLLLWDTGIKKVFLEILKEFGWPEFFDWVPIRPGLIILCSVILQSESLGTVWGHGAADVVFYGLGFSNTGLRMAEAFSSIITRAIHIQSSWRI